MLALFPEVPKIQRRKALKSTFSITPLDAQSQREPSRISIQNLYYEKLESLSYIFAVGNVGICSFKYSL